MFSWAFQLSGSKTDNLVARSYLNVSQVGADCRKISLKFLCMFHSVLSDFLNNWVFHFTTSISSSGEQISGHAYPSSSTTRLTVMRSGVGDYFL
jgi:hypothetical protein